MKYFEPSDISGAENCLLKNNACCKQYKVRNKPCCSCTFSHSEDPLVLNFVKHLKLFSVHLLQLKDLRQMFLLLIRHLKPEITCIQHLGEVICTNHEFLAMAEKFCSLKTPGTFDMLQHMNR